MALKTLAEAFFLLFSTLFFFCSPSAVTAACSLRGGTETPSELPPCFQGVWEEKGSGGVRDGGGEGLKARGGTIRTNGAIHSFILITSAN